MAKVAREMKVATQMGNQGTAESGLRKAAAWLRAGAIGPVSEVHIWTNRPIWPQGKTGPRRRRRARQREVGPLDRSGADAAVQGPARQTRPGENGSQRGLSSVRLARLVGFRLRRPGRHGLPQLQHGLHGPGPPQPGVGRGPDLGPQQGQLSRVVDRHLSVRRHGRSGRPSNWSGTTAASVRPPNCSKADGPGGRAVGHRRQGQAARHRIPGKNPPERPKVEFPVSPGHFEEWVRAIRGGEPAMSNFPNYAGPLAEPCSWATWPSTAASASSGTPRT